MTQASRGLGNQQQFRGEEAPSLQAMSRQFGGIHSKAFLNAFLQELSAWAAEIFVKLAKILEWEMHRWSLALETLLKLQDCCISRDLPVLSTHRVYACRAPLHKYGCNFESMSVASILLESKKNLPAAVHVAEGLICPQYPVSSIPPFRLVGGDTCLHDAGNQMNVYRLALHRSVLALLLGILRNHGKQACTLKQWAMLLRQSAMSTYLPKGLWLLQILKTMMPQ